MFGEIYHSQLVNFTSLDGLLDNILVSSICILELVGLMVSLILLVTILRLSRSKDVFHTNLSLCLYYYYVCDIIMATIRIVYLYEEFMDSATQTWEHLFSEARVMFIVTTLAGMPVILLERACATYYLGRYEKKRRLHIPILCLLVPNTLLFSTYPYWVNTGNILYSGVVALIVTIVAFSGYIWLVAYNGKRLRQMYKGHSRYSLASRYQIDENGRVFTIMRSAFFVVSLHFALIPAAIISASFASSNLLEQLLHAATELLLSTIPIPTILCFILNTKEWRFEVMRFFCGDRAVVERIPIQARQGDAYFNHLAKLWNIPIEPDVNSETLP